MASQTPDFSDNILGNFSAGAFTVVNGVNGCAFGLPAEGAAAPPQITISPPNGTILQSTDIVTIDIDGGSNVINLVVLKVRLGREDREIVAYDGIPDAAAFSGPFKNSSTVTKPTDTTVQIQLAHDGGWPVDFIEATAKASAGGATTL